MLLQTTSLPLEQIRKGKVRDVYAVDRESVLLVATDRVSAFDVVMAETIPDKGTVLTQLSAWWLEKLDGVEHHMITADTNEIVARVPKLTPHADELAGRSMLCRRAEIFPVECVIRGYLSGSAWKEYKSRGTLAGEALPKGLRESERLDPALFSPATKAEEGHDENITRNAMAAIVGSEAATELERLTRSIYDFGREVAAERGIIIADTKLEFGRARAGSDGRERIILVDEVLTPDSSRFWPAGEYAPGKSQPGFDKQPLRDYLDSERRAGRWDGNHPPPPLPTGVIEAMSARYRSIFEMLTGSSLSVASGA